MKNKKKNFKEIIQLTPKRISVLGIFLSLLLVFKYIFGFVPGIETTTFFFVIFGIFLPILDLTLLLVSFNLSLLAIYGISYWWIMYWVIWPIVAYTSKLFSLKIKNVFAFSLLGFIFGFSIAFWDFILNLSLQGIGYAKLNLITALPINTIEGFVTMFLIITLSPIIQKIFSLHSSRFWQHEVFKFTTIKNFKISLASTISLSLISLSGIVTLFSTNDLFTLWSNNKIRGTLKQNYLKNDVSLINIYDGSRLKDETTTGTINKYLYNTDYNNILRKLKTKPGKQVAVVVIASGKFYTDFIDVNNIKRNTNVVDILQNSKRFIFKGLKHGMIYEFRFKKNKLQLKSDYDLHGNTTRKWSLSIPHYFPLYYINHRFASLYANKQTVKENDILEITYDHT
ncbi:MAG: hypothetical protein GY679_03685 [Mycoplasma sp.]|nr:hypothetical protein [Mycoplasma sp.]